VSIDTQLYHDLFNRRLSFHRDSRKALADVVMVAHAEGVKEGQRSAPSAGTPEAEATPGHGTPGQAAAL